MEALRPDAALRAVPVVVETQQVPETARRRALEDAGVTVLAKAVVWPNRETLVSAVIRSVEGRHGTPAPRRSAGEA
jgi:hypothetical protein